MKALFLSIFVILGISGCSTPHIKIGLPNCDKPVPVSETIWNDLDLLRETMSYNQLVDAECVELLRSRIRLHDEDS